ncbi:GyrI-like domain-containing protein [Flammeovirga sp. SJP92]|uniref:AraC family transcriptional regulator n=1 Tax=Flammeovirga sp. SJP92 TaxID=1775430 RepID=UPI000787931E|nr:GyrI-like domain-containing protein [Flammeovirga sp. SJP92]KXX69788.1 AraC family transcriptional regulator [Flammeovirga sp. SJP92]
MTESDKELQADHRSRINRVFEFIEHNLASDLSLKTVAEVAFFSPYHFHRIFKLMTGETLNKYITRKRIEKSASDLLHQNTSTSALAHKYGFSDNSSYSRTFKKYYGVSPTEFKNLNTHRFSKISQLKSKNGQEYPDYEEYICIIDQLKNWIKMNAKIEVMDIPKRDVAYVSCIGPQNLSDAFGTLMQWATPKGLLKEETKMMTIYHDSFKITEPQNVRMSASMVLDTPIKSEGEIGHLSLEGGKAIVGHFVIGIDEFEKSWTGLFLWMNENGYKKADREPFEIYHNNFNEHPERKAIVDFCIPVE